MFQNFTIEKCFPVGTPVLTNKFARSQAVRCNRVLMFISFLRFTVITNQLQLTLWASLYRFVNLIFGYTNNNG